MAEKMEMKSMDITQENIRRIGELFPDSVTEIKENGKVKLAIDFDALKANLSHDLMEEGKERYQMTWPDKKKAKLLASQVISDTLRPCREESVDFDNTKNLYIEGDNLDVLKVLRETYLGKVKMIYIDPPYNTGSDFVYNDDFSMDKQEYKERSGEYDEEGNQLFQNLESNGRFHTDWLNMIYPRLKVARDLLSDDGVVFISIDDNEQENLKKMCNEIFGEDNYIATLVRKTKTTSNNGNQFAPSHEYIEVCCKSIHSLCTFNDPEAQEDEDYIKLFRFEDEYSKYNVIGLYQPALKHGGSSYPIECPDGSFVVTPEGKPWRWNEKTFLENKLQNKVVFKETKTSPLLTTDGKQSKWNIYTKLYLKDRLESGMRPITFIDKYTNSEASKELLKMNIPFDFSKPRRLIQYLTKICNISSGDIVLDFFSGSATTAHAVMQLNAEDGGNRQFIMVQLPEKIDEKSEAYKAGYKNICEIGKERIRRAGNKIKEDNPLTTQTLDTGFRVLKLDSSNMQNVYYNPSEMPQSLLETTVDNIKSDRTPMDLLFQVMLNLGLELSAKIEQKQINGKTIFIVNDNDLIACFDSDIDNEVITSIAKMQPLYAVFRDSSFATDSVGINNEQLFKTYSPSTIIKVL